MYLSKVTMKSSPQTAQELAKLQRNGVYASHQLIWQLFTNDAERSFLYREEIGATGMPEFYVLSKTEPQANLPIFSSVTKVFEPKLDKGQRLSFKLRVNPTVCVKGEGGKQRRHDVMMQAKYSVKNELLDAQKLKMHMEQAAIGWLSNEKRLDEWGITLDCQPAIDGYTQHKVQKKRHQIQFSSVDYQGMLTVKDPLKFINQYAKGFGRAKGMGCGLMMIKRA
ncbi:type I-E CRISPR-associated protein Cas6/Cse3/CasE [Alteromonas sp. B31-7]|jgi:CRISPR system Cascade subunit CasE|uniref:type I-E CRISPR-associated protein Cas6/Cse3/CasE n=1 Tax=Alteromonas sp. B31-7 TaxID=2785913 RepID=UPI0018C8F18C|nr:type I-E CRISPR-associated protein Cas6/Cse3/CasE [Alteromonas sp. B31-7]QPL51918.1 type I-E CRISPR-associated protein Cas6/Cse3/CasE [Alteromonas sp. B31-7]|tara:strand:- start:5317 stop:5985 length:669 start_codon:yes stop_codon:yes gene_type:complete